jgi:hypothetical protein
MCTFLLAVAVIGLLWAYREPLKGLIAKLRGSA